MKTFWASSWMAILSRFIIILPFALSIILCLDFGTFEIGFIVFGLFLSYILYSIVFGWYLGFVNFKNRYVYVPGDIIPNFNKLQYKVKVCYDNICAIEFKVRDGNSKGEELYKAWSILYLEIITNDNFVYRINMNKFSKKQCIKIENMFIKKVPEILVLKSINKLIKYRKN